jgi:CheY-like chemotaxis protein
MLSLEAIRHKEANWWGIKTLWDCHKVFTEGAFDLEYPVNIKEELHQLNNFLYTFCYSTSEERLSQILENKRAEIADEIECLNQRIQNIQTKQTEESSDLEENKLLIDLCIEDIERINLNLRYIIRPDLRKPILQQLNQTKALLDEYSNAKQDKENSLEEEGKVEQETVRQLEDISLPSKTYADTKQLFDLKDEAFNLNNAKVLLIDDQAEDGWSEIYQHIIYGRKDKNPFTILPFNHLNDIKLWLDECEDINQFDFILLDLRLFPKVDKEIEDSPELISGIEILKYLRSNDCFVPILITSASNKIWSYKIAIQYGADAYWCKEGVDNLFDANASMTNYLELKQWFATFMSNEYSYLKEMSLTLMKFKSDFSTNFWWKRKDWGISNSVVNKQGQTIELPRHTELKLNEIKQIYLHGTNMYRSYIKARFDTKEISKGHSWFYYSIVIVQFAKILELIHNVTEKRYDTFGSYYAVMKARNDSTGKELYSIRNDAVHFYTSKNITITTFKEYLHKLNQYLMNG